MAWATLDQLKVKLGVPVADTASDALLSQELAQAIDWAQKRRAETCLYPLDDNDTSPGATETDGVLLYAIIGLGSRGIAAARAAGGTGLDTPTMTAVRDKLGISGGGGGFA